VQRAREQMGGLRAEVATVVEPGMVYGDFVELRVRELSKQDRARRGIQAMSPEVHELGAAVRREPAWLEIAALVASLVFFVAALLLG
jgi:hypothetical protein